MPETLGEYVRRVRRDHRMTQGDLAEAVTAAGAKTSAKTVSDWERGIAPLTGYQLSVLPRVLPVDLYQLTLMLVPLQSPTGNQ